MRVLVIEDDRPLREALRQGLEEAGFAVDTSAHGEEGLWYARSNENDVIVLDLMLPGIDGLTILGRLRQEGCAVPILILTARDTVEDRVRGLNLGADDYLVKPFAFQELLARVRALVRRGYNNKDPIISVEDLEIDTTGRTVRRGDKSIALSRPRVRPPGVPGLPRRPGCLPHRHLGAHLRFPLRSGEQRGRRPHRALAQEDRATGPAEADPYPAGTRLYVGAMRLMKTLRARLVIGTALGTGLVFSVSALVLYGVVHAALWAEFDASLGSKARSLAALVEQEGSRLDLEIEEIGLTEFAPSERAEYFQFWSGPEQVLGRSASLNGDDLDQLSGPDGSPAYRSVSLPDGRPGRLVGMTFVPRREIADEHETGSDRYAPPPPGSTRGRFTVMLVVGWDSIEIDTTLGRLRLLLVCGCIGAILVAVGVLSWFVRRGLRPVGDLAVEIASIGETNLSNRLAASNTPGELLPITTRLNDLLARIETAFAREKGLTADVAHELRTPAGRLALHARGRAVEKP